MFLLILNVLKEYKNGSLYLMIHVGRFGPNQTFVGNLELLERRGCSVVGIQFCPQN